METPFKKKIHYEQFKKAWQFYKQPLSSLQLNYKVFYLLLLFFVFLPHENHDLLSVFTRMPYNQNCNSLYFLCLSYFVWQNTSDIFAVLCVLVNLLFMSKNWYITSYSFIVSFYIEHVWWFWLLGVINKAYLNIFLVSGYVFNFVGYLLEK